MSPYKKQSTPSNMPFDIIGRQKSLNPLFLLAVILLLANATNSIFINSRYRLQKPQDVKRSISKNLTSQYHISDKVTPYIKFDVKLKPVIEAGENRRIMLGCRASGSPPPELYWKFTKPGESPKNGEAKRLDAATQELLSHIHSKNGISTRGGPDTNYMIETNYVSRPKVSWLYGDTDRLAPYNPRISNPGSRYYSGRRSKRRAPVGLPDLDGIVIDDSLLDLLKIGGSLRDNTDGQSEDSANDEAPTIITSANEQLGLGMTQSRIVIDCLSESDIGTYTCVAKNDVKTIEQSTTIKLDTKAKRKMCIDVQHTKKMNEEADIRENLVAKLTSDLFTTEDKREPVMRSPARIYMWTTNRIENQGSGVQIFCRSTGNPTPIIGWLTPDGDLVKEGDKYKILENGDLQIRNIDWNHDMGAYSCIVRNQYGVDVRKAFVYPINPKDTLTDENTKAEDE